MIVRYKNLAVISIILLWLLCACHSSSDSRHQDNKHILSIVDIVKNQHDIAINREHKEITIRNNYGDIYVRQSDQAFLGVLSTMQVFSGTQAIADISITETSPEIVIDINYTAMQVQQAEKLNQAVGRVDLVVFVPEHLQLDLTTSFGVINVKEVSNELLIKSQSGTVKSSSTGKVSIETSEGNIYCNLIDPQWQGQSQLKSLSGNVFLTFPDIQNMNVYAESGTGILNNFEAKVIKNGKTQKFIHPSPLNTIKLFSKQGFIKLVSVEHNNYHYAKGKTNNES